MYPKKNEEFIIPTNPQSEDVLLVGSNAIAFEVESPVLRPRDEREQELLDRRRLLKETLAFSSEIHSARKSDIDRRLHDFQSDKVKRIISSLISGNIGLGGQDIDDQRDRITRNIMNLEVEIGTEIFKGSGVEGTHTVFISHDRVDEAFWHFESEVMGTKPVTTRYVLREQDAYKSIDGQPFLLVEKQELSNLRDSIAMIHGISSRGLYKDSLRSDFDLAA